MIDEFKGRYFFLSNFYNRDVTFEGLTYKNTECAFQAQKCLGRRKEFVNLTPNEGKRLGRKVHIRKDWEFVKDDIMYRIVKCKFTQHEDLKRRLIDTGDEELLEGNTWNDTYWGIDINTRQGYNKLGKILMRVRDEIRSYHV